MSYSSIVDVPKKASETDLFGIDKYKNGLIKFIRNSDTPLTIAIQGEWGSGKTSLLNSLQEKLCGEYVTADEFKDHKHDFYGIWINTWQYSLMRSQDETLLSIVSGITNKILQIINARHKSGAEKLGKSILNFGSKVFKSTAALAAEKVIGEGASSLVENILARENSNQSISALRDDLQESIVNCLQNDAKMNTSKRGFIFFIDDLDLELIKNIFEVDNCIFVLAIDYEVVVKGLIPKFGPLTEKNEREFRSFFDKIIQLPFSMPVAMYDVNHFLLQSLEDVGYINDELAADEAAKDRLADFAMLSVGTNPRSLKRLINTLSLLNIIDNLKSSNARPKYELVVNFGLVCIQIAYPAVYNALVEEPEFKDWNEKTAKKMRLAELSEAQEISLKDTTEFDEEWERVLFRICQKEPYLSSRAFQVSQLLNFMAESIPDNVDFGNDISRILGASAVTSVHVDFTPRQGKKGEKVRYEGWAGFENMLKANKSITGFIPTFKQIHDYFEQEFEGLIQFNYTPNFLTIACSHPISRSRTLIFIRIKKDFVLFEFAGQTIPVKIIADFTEAMKVDLKMRFNELSSKKK